MKNMLIGLKGVEPEPQTKARLVIESELESSIVRSFNEPTVYIFYFKSFGDSMY